MGIFEMFSKRDQQLPDVYQYDQLPEKLRTQIGWIWRNCSPQFTSAHWSHFLKTVHEAVCTEHGKMFLFDKEARAHEDLMVALLNLRDTDIVLDIVHTFFRFLERELAQIVGWGQSPFVEMVKELNHRFRENGVGYEFNIDAHRLERIDEQFTHEQVVRPALALLAALPYKTANAEFLEALEDFKKSDFDDCLTKCQASFESVLKILCHRKGWPYSPSDHGADLVGIYMKHSGLPPFFKKPLVLVATIRNEFSSSHGQGTQPKNVPEYLARYEINATASAIILVVEAAK